MRNKIQENKIIARLQEKGEVDNLWAIRNYILRLGAVIHRLSEQRGLSFTTRWGTNENKKNYYYKINKNTTWKKIGKFTK